MKKGSKSLRPATAKKPAKKPAASPPKSGVSQLRMNQALTTLDGNTKKMTFPIKSTLNQKVERITWAQKPHTSSSNKKNVS